MSSGRRAYDILRSFVNSEWERIRGIDLDKALAELDAPAAPTVAGSIETAPTLRSSDPKALARSVLGVSETADFEEIRKAFERLNERSEPARFPEGSEEQKHASQIQTRVNWAYQTLTEEVPTTEKRFRSLEIE